MKNVAKKSTSLKPLCPPKNGLLERLVNGCARSPDLSDQKLEERQKMSAYSGQTKENCTKNSSKDPGMSDENSCESLLDVSCVEVDGPNVKSLPDNDLGPCSRSSTPASVIRMASDHASGVAKATEKGADLLSDDEVIICDRSSPGANRPLGTKSPNGLVCRVDNFEIFENKVDSDEQASKHADDKEIEVIDVDGSVAVTASDEEAAKKRAGVKRISVDDALSNEVSRTKKSRLEAAEAAVLTSFVNAQHNITDHRDNKITSTSKHLNELIRTCIEEYINRSHGSVIRQLKAEVNQLKKSRDEWKEIADKLRKEIALVQSTHQRTERRRSSVTRVQRRSVGCQAREKACNALNRSPGRSSASETGKVVAPATSNDSTVALAPSVLPPASSNLSTNQRLKWIHQQGIRMSNPGLVSGALKSVSLPVASELSLVPLTVRPQTVSAMPSSSTVMIDLTAEDDGRTRQQQNAIVPGGILGSIVQPGNMVIAPNSSAYLLYTPPSRPAVIKPGEVAGVAGLPTIALGSSMATGEGYHSLPSLVSINNRPGTVLQVVNMRPPPPLQSAPLRSTLPVLAPANLQRIAVSSPAVLQHPAPLPPSPINQPAPLDARQIPPKPTLKLSRVAQGIVLSWNASITVLQEEPSTYQLYAYQQGHELPSSTLWKKVGNVKALALPMACTLTQFQVGNKYHFAVRAVDRHGRVGPFSEPGSIHLEGGTT